MQHDLDIPEFLKIPADVRAAAWRDRKMTRPRRGGGMRRRPMTAFENKIAEAAREQARRLASFPILDAWEAE